MHAEWRGGKGARGTGGCVVSQLQQLQRKKGAAAFVWQHRITGNCRAVARKQHTVRLTQGTSGMDAPQRLARGQ